MLSGLLITLDILVCLALIGVVLLQRSEGGAFGMGSGPTGLITARGAGDLLTRSTWVLFSLFLAISLGLTLLGEHDRAATSLEQKLKQEQILPGAPTAPAQTAPSPVGPPAGAPTSAPLTGPISPFTAPPASQLMPASATVAPGVAAPKPAHAVATKPKHAAAAPAAQAAPTIAPAPAQSAPPPPVLVAPPPQPAP